MPNFELAFAPLFTELSDREAEFHGATMLGALLALEPLVALNSAEAARLYREIAVLQAKRDEVDAFDWADKTLAAQAETGVLAPDRIYFMHLECSQISTYERPDTLRKFDHVRAALAIAAGAGAPPIYVLKLRQDYGKWLEVFERHEEALASNMALLVDAEAQLGADALDLHYLLSHIALNHRSLGRPDEALTWLERRLVVLRKGGDVGRVLDAYGTIADLHFEQGAFDKAKAAHAARLAHAQAAGNDTWVRIANEGYAEHFDGNGRPLTQNTESSCSIRTTTGT